jgi:amidohydrolase
MNDPESLYAAARRHFDDIVRIRRDIHQHPETGFDVARTAALAAGAMEELGLVVRRGVGRTGVTADLDVPGSSRRFALRADMDALAMQEETPVPFRSSRDGKAHMCGHDVHTAALIGTARVLCDLAGHLKTSVRFLFQPNEESLPGGALSMIEDGALQGVDEIYGLHVLPALEAGSFGLRDGAFLGQPDSFEIKIRGKGGHGAMPHYAVDPLYVGALFVTAVQSIVSRNTDPFTPVVVSVTQFHAGTSDNIIPAEAVIVGTVRTLDDAVQQSIRKRLEEILGGITRANGATYELAYTEGYPVTRNHGRCVARAVAAATALVGEKHVVYPYPAVLGGEDFGYYGQHIPACFAFIGCGNREKGIVEMCHHPGFDVDETCMLHAMAYFAAIVASEK